jgi:hypothetical protein
MASHKYVWKSIDLVSEPTIDGVFPSTAGLCDDPSEGSVMGRLPVLHLQEEGRCGRQHQSLCLMVPATAIDRCHEFRPGDDRHAPRRCPLRNLLFLQSSYHIFYSQ